MTNKESAITCKKYYLESIYWGAIAMAVYRKLLFRPIPGLGLEASKAVLWVLVVSSVFIGAAVTFRNLSFNLVIITNIAIPYCIRRLVSL